MPPPPTGKCCFVLLPLVVHYWGQMRRRPAKEENEQGHGTERPEIPTLPQHVVVGRGILVGGVGLWPRNRRCQWVN